MPPRNQTKSVGYFLAKRNNIVIFNSTQVIAKHDGRHLHFESIVNLGQPDQEVFYLLIEKTTSSGEKQFKPGGELFSVNYLMSKGDMSAYSGTFNADLDQSTENYRLSFDLKFVDDTENSIEGKFHITGTHSTLKHTLQQMNHLSRPSIKKPT